MPDELDSFITRALGRGSSRPTYPQGHPAMATARNIVNQILDEAGADIDTRQRINDDCDQFVAWMVERYATGVDG